MKKPFCILIGLSVFMTLSCASKPKTAPETFPDIPMTEQDTSSSAGTDSSESSSLPLDGDSTSSSGVSAAEPEEPVLEEVSAEELPVLPEPAGSGIESDETDTVFLVDEPEVKDISSMEKENTDMNVSRVLKADDAQESSGTVSDGHSVQSGGRNAGDKTASVSGISSFKAENAPSGIDIDSSSDGSAADDDSSGVGKIPPVPSRTMTVKRNQLIEVVYPGKGWIYQENIDSDGNVDSRNKNFIFGGRKLGGENQSFTLRSRSAGKFLLHFYKNDVLSGNYIDDYLEVVVEDGTAGSTGLITAPDYADAVPPKAVITAETIKAQKKTEPAKKQNESSSAEKKLGDDKNGSSCSSAGQQGSVSPAAQKSVSKENDSDIKTVIQTTESRPSSDAPVVNVPSSEKEADGSVTPSVRKADGNEVVSAPDYSSASSVKTAGADDLLKTASELYDRKEYSQAFETLKLFFNKAVNKIDEGLYLQAQILEAKSEIQNIKGAVDSYELLVKNYPASRLWDAANKRSIYLKRFYINIR